MNDTANFSFTSNGLHKTPKASFAPLNWGSEIMDQGLLFVALLRNDFDRRSDGLERRNLEETAIFLMDTQVKLF